MKIQHKRSAALDGGKAKEPTALQTDLGELCVNFNTADPALFIRDNADNIVRVGGDLSLYQKVDEVGSAVFVCSPSDIDGQSPPAERLEGTLWWNTEAGVLYVWYEDVDSSQWVIAVPQVGADEIPPGTTVDTTPPSPAEEGQLWWNSDDVETGGGRLYVYYDNSWIDTSVPGGGFSGDYNDLSNQPDLFSGDYNDLINKPNIPPEFNLDDGSVENDIIHWAELGSVQEISSTESGGTSSGNSYSNIAATGGSGTGLVCNVIRRKNTGAHEVYVAVRGEGYNAGEIVFLDLGYDPAAGGGTGSAGINCTIDQVNDVVDGWVARPGNDYYVSSINDSVNTGMPQFMSGIVTGGDADSFSAVGGGGATLNLFPIGDKSTTTLAYIGNQAQHLYKIPGTAGSPKVYHTLINKDTGDYFCQFSQLPDRIQFFDWYGGAKNLIFDAARDTSSLTGAVRIYRDSNANSNQYLKLTTTTIESAGMNNIALSISSSNGKYNFKKADGTSNGYTINAENGNAGFILAEDAALASNYDADGEYIGPIQDRVADLIARVSAIESNEVADDAVDSALLTLVASLSQRLDERDQQITTLTASIAGLTARIAALEGA